MTRDSEFALSFGKAVSDYERGRPGYPDEAIDWILKTTGTTGAKIAVDIGAGTGKFTASLVARGLTVVAVEPDATMLERLVEKFPGVTAIAGSAESIPLADASADLVTFAQAWHWVDVPTASVEVARVLRSDGALALVWNIRDPEVDWVEQLGVIMGASKAEQYDSHKPSVSAPLRLAEFGEFRWEHPMSREELFAMVTSRSYVIAMDATERAALLVELGTLLDTHPAVAGLDVFRMPYVTRVTIARR